ncbi:hypothetical protein [Wolbachia endosymbiont (group B) of Tholera decimalis]
MNLLYITHYPKSCATKPFQCWNDKRGAPGTAVTYRMAVLE